MGLLESMDKKLDVIGARAAKSDMDIAFLTRSVRRMKGGRRPVKRLKYKGRGRE